MTVLVLTTPFSWVAVAFPKFPSSWDVADTLYIQLRVSNIYCVPSPKESSPFDSVALFPADIALAPPFYRVAGSAFKLPYETW